MAKCSSMSKYLTYTLIGMFLCSTLFLLDKNSFIRADTNKDLMTLLHTSNPWMETERNIFIKYGQFCEITNVGSHVDQLNERLDMVFGFHMSSHIMQERNDHIVVENTVRDSEEHLTISSRLVQWNQHRIPYLTILISANEKTDADTLMQVQQIVENGFQTLGCPTAAHVMIQGYLREEIFPQDPTWWQDIEQSLKSKRIDHYDDERTIIRTYDSAMLTHGIPYDTYHVNFQLALRQETDTHRWRLTLGTPLITINEMQ